jgi:hypothetical protein
VTVSDYASLEQLKDYMGQIPADITTLDQIGTQALASASRTVERICGRHFYQTTETQFFSPSGSPWLLDLDDMEIATKTDLAVGVQWANSLTPYSEARLVDVDFELTPVNQSVNGIDGWPWTGMRSFSKLWPPRYADFYKDTVSVTGTFGWAAVPGPVVTATLMIALDTVRMKDAPFGMAGFGDYGPVRAKDNPQALMMLQPYRKQTTLMLA